MKSRGTLPKKKFLEKKDESLQIVKLHNSEAKSSWANAVKMGLESTNSIKAAVKVSCTKTLEIEEKDRSIIMFNHPESTKTHSVERKKDDIEFVHSSSIKAYKFQNNQFSLVSDLVNI